MWFSRLLFLSPATLEDGGHVREVKAVYVAVSWYIPTDLKNALPISESRGLYSPVVVSKIASFCG